MEHVIINVAQHSQFKNALSMLFISKYFRDLVQPSLNIFQFNCQYHITDGQLLKLLDFFKIKYISLKNCGKFLTSKSITKLNGLQYVNLMYCDFLENINMGNKYVSQLSDCRDLNITGLTLFHDTAEILQKCHSITLNDSENVCFCSEYFSECHKIEMMGSALDDEDTQYFRNCYDVNILSSDYTTANTMHNLRNCNSVQFSLRRENKISKMINCENIVLYGSYLTNYVSKYLRNCKRIDISNTRIGNVTKLTHCEELYIDTRHIYGIISNDNDYSVNKRDLLNMPMLRELHICYSPLSTLDEIVFDVNDEDILNRRGISIIYEADF